jgi:hypothetical protein
MASEGDDTAPAEETGGKGQADAAARRSSAIEVNADTPQETLVTLAGTTGLTLEVTHLDLKRLPAHVRANLRSSAESFVAPALKSAGNIEAERATVLHAPELAQAGDVEAPLATDIDLRKLGAAARIDLHAAEVLELDGLRRCNYITGFKARAIHAPLLEEARFLLLPSVEALSLPSLRRCGSVDFGGAENVSLPQLEELSGELFLGRGTSLAAPHLQSFADQIRRDEWRDRPLSGGRLPF